MSSNADATKVSNDAASATSNIARMTPAPLKAGPYVGISRALFVASAHALQFQDRRALPALPQRLPPNRVRIWEDRVRRVESGGSPAGFPFHRMGVIVPCRRWQLQRKALGIENHEAIRLGDRIEPEHRHALAAIRLLRC